MPIYLDDEAIALSGNSLGDVLHAAREQIAEQGRVVVEVQIDGQSLVDHEIDEQQDAAIGQREVRLFTADPVTLAVGTLGQVRDVLDVAQRVQTDAAELFQQDRSGDAIQRVAEAMSIWQQTQQAVLHSAVLLELDLDQREVEGIAVSETVNDLITHLTSLRDQLAAGDTVAVADALAFEWPQTVERWQKLIDAMIGWIEA
jgi:hypothetical protein